MIEFNEAYAKVLEHSLELGSEVVALRESVGRILSEDILADRDFPPFDRVTKDGIAINSQALEAGIGTFGIEALASAGMPQQKLKNTHNCIEVMTGAVVPQNTDTVVMYEHIKIKDGHATLTKEVKKGQEIHYKGSDVVSGTVLLHENSRIGPAEIGVLATVGKSELKVKRLPKVMMLSTGNELVEVSEKPKPHQIRKSNVLSLYAALRQEGIPTASMHLKDDRSLIKEELTRILEMYDVLLLSGGVSMGKFDFIPGVLEDLQVEKVFHRVAQKPGKPFWFGKQTALNTVVFSFPGNPVSTFANYHLYFLPWLYRSLGIEIKKGEVVLGASITVKPPLTRFMQVKIENRKGCLWAFPVRENGSGDLTSLVHSDGFVCLPPREEPYGKGEVVTFVGTR
ncbi:molybdopterin molybdotransferase MoeA [Maribacter polysaccharolyticus]|uniref:molybdopterin molybdotransferase MoeA n=1 Tax=Maribacter polysaccharolyticus TaxID=3020831 RepID=UPI00237F9899|nr:molybdopterin molybdotransferase MoeA [Maribacter polysaccharolyticus]MDE3743826.1 molybdopterin molybdotransferase MoeA [Maribacter polysaccharolyticus]